MTTKAPSFPIVAICAASDGLGAALDLCRASAAQIAAAFVIFIDPEHVDQFMNGLESKDAPPVARCVPGTPIEPGRIHVLRSDLYMRTVGGKLHAVEADRPDLGSARLFLRALAQERGADAIVVLLGRDPDFAREAKAVKQAGGVVLSFIDLMERQRAANLLCESEARMRAIIDGADDAIIASDSAGRIRWVNSAASQIFGYGADEMIGADIGFLTVDPDRSMPAGGVGREIEALRKDGSLFPAELKVSETRHGGERLRVSFLRDLSERRLLEARLQKMDDNRLAAMANMATELAHEINQPLVAAVNYLAAAQARGRRSGALPAEISELMEAAASQVVRAGRIVSRLRRFIADTEPEKFEQRLHGLIVAACELVSPMLREAGIRPVLRLDATPDLVLVDGVQIEQAFVNLLRNAVQAMSKSRTKNLTVATSAGDGMIRVDVSDSGTGLSGAEQIDLFLPFTTARPEGLGVGLSISRAIVEAHHGKMWAKKNETDGATFSFTLPLAGDEPANE
ncbi:PAS domain S-box protein [Rhodoblastus acidophilus]|uniref:histidine kinase n=1 Tax=Candidatus Rhodoblastus alkanivorans TaxID=2954117 RepID=A0ABS9Z2H3_9HYPH|nr:ATP-binding protein [Candidatus Rhodoblastus alkanivorans]MCI4677492.1 PAS domain S-box protein [Candidatus Rhodoblastus alkanivorans]MCI4681851.1 PAS domain S-box protein [Candidatus Rhodoblastus alkanivorans]MDI4642901.1 PAS domain S-box protein [Rhodoblastus acidophilus]